MRILYYDCFSGISGDMNLAAMLDLGIKEKYLRSELKKLNLDGWELRVEKEQRHGIFGTMVTVVQTRKERVHRHMADISEIIESSVLDKEVKKTSLSIFRVLAEAEAKVHNTTVEKIHFHEVGAIDSIVDIVGAAICYHKLEVTDVIVGNLELGGGFVKCEHGTLPVPAPATAEIIKGFRVSTGGVDFEATTPTGAAILKTLASRSEENSRIKIASTGYGIGHKINPAKPNILRVHLCTEEKRSGGQKDSYLVECNLDDMNPEWYDTLISRLLKGGVSDAFLTPVIMKQGRPGTKVTVLVNRENLESAKETLFKHSTTLGLRIIEVDKHTLEREFKVISTPLGDVTVKFGYYNGELVSVKPEHKDCHAIAEKKNLSLKEVTRVVLDSINSQ